MEDALLRVEGLTTCFYTMEGKVRAVNDVSFDIKKGRVLGIVGESGCGKSVTSLSIMGLIEKPYGEVESGKIIFEGRDLLKISQKEMEGIRGNRIAMIFQEPMTCLNPVFKIGEQIGESLLIHKKIKGKENRDKCIEMLKLVSIPSPEKIINEYPHQLSGGMRQRVMIAMALSCSPSLIIADEPTTALDVTIQAQVLELMKKLQKGLDTSIMLITHDLGVIAEMAEDVVVMYAGRVVEKTTAAELFKNPLHPYTNGLLLSRTNGAKKSEKLYCIPGMVPNLFDMPKGCPFSTRCEKCMDICKEKVPELYHKGNEHMVRCFLYSEDRSE